jgi:hypothetical protein
MQHSSDSVVLDQLDDDFPYTHRKGLAISVILPVLVLVLVLVLAVLRVMLLVAAVPVGIGVLVICNCTDAGTALRSIPGIFVCCVVVSTVSLWTCRKPVWLTRWPQACSRFFKTAPPMGLCF